MIARWVGIAKVREGDSVPDGASYTIHPEVIYLHFQFLRVIGARLKIGLAPAIGSSFKLLRRAWYEELHHPTGISLGGGLTWTKVFEIKLSRGYV